MSKDKKEHKRWSFPRPPSPKLGKESHIQSEVEALLQQQSDEGSGEKHYTRPSSGATSPVTITVIPSDNIAGVLGDITTSEESTHATYGRGNNTVTTTTSTTPTTPTDRAASTFSSGSPRIARARGREDQISKEETASKTQNKAMVYSSKKDLKKAFKKGARPTEEDFSKLIDAFVHQGELQDLKEHLNQTIRKLNRLLGFE